MTSAIEATNVQVVRGGNRVVSGVSLGFPSGAWTGLIGANGSGKTSLLRAIGGRLPLANGVITFGGQDLTRQRAQRARAVGFAPPPETLPAELSVREVLSFAGEDFQTALANTAEIGAALGLETLLDKQIGACSAGMRQRVAIACAFAPGRELVILDEPFNWLDPVAAFDLKQSLRQMVDNGLTLITALHDMSSFTQLCDAGALLVDGRVAIELDRQQLRSGATNLAAFEQRMIDLLRAPATGERLS